MPITDEQLKQIIEAAILAASEPLSIDKMLTLFVEEKEPPTRDAIKEAIKAIEVESESRGVELKKVSSGYRFQAKKDFAPWVSRLWEEKPARYSRALLETLVLIAYKQPLTRGEIEHVRGVAVSTNIIKTLLEREWVRVVGHRDVPGKPALYATTKAFLDYFNLKSLEELPTLAEIRDLDKINAELDLQEPGVEQADAGEDGVTAEQVAQSDAGEVTAEASEATVEAEVETEVETVESVDEQSFDEELSEEQSAELQDEELLPSEEVIDETVSSEATSEEFVEEVSDEDIDSNQDDRDDVMLDEHDREMESRLAVEEEEIIAATKSMEDASQPISESGFTSVTEHEPSIEQEPENSEPVVSENQSDEEPKLETASVESDDYSELEGVDSKLVS